jgi:hypothetical protein
LFLRSLIAKRPVEVFVTQFLVEEEMDSILLIPDTVIKTTMAILERKKALKPKLEKKQPLSGRISGPPVPSLAWL